MCSALLLGLVLGALARAIIPNDAFQGVKGPKSWLISLGLGIGGALLGWLIFTGILGWGDRDAFDWGWGLLSGLIGTLILLGLGSMFLRRSGRASGGGSAR